MPVADKSEVFIGMTKWSSMSDFAKAGEKLLSKAVAADFFSTFDMKAYVQVQLLSKKDFNLLTLAKDGQILELAVRTYKDGKKEEFEAAKNDFITLLKKQSAFVADYEFVVLGENKENLSVGMTVYKSQEELNKMLDPNGELMKNPITGKFFSLLKPKALQFAVSVK